MPTYYVTPMDGSFSGSRYIRASGIKEACIEAVERFAPQDIWSMEIAINYDKTWICNYDNVRGWHYYSAWGGKPKKLFPDGGPRPPTYPEDDGKGPKRGSSKPKASKSVRSLSTKPGVYTMDDWNRDRRFSAQPGQEVSAEVYEEMQWNGPRYIPVSLLDKWGCVRGFLTANMFADPEMYGAFGETPDGRYLYLGLSKRIKGYPEGPATWFDEFYHEPKRKSTKKGAKVASDARKCKNVHGKPGECTQQTPSGSSRDRSKSGSENKSVSSKSSKSKSDTTKGKMTSNARKSKSSTPPRNKKGRFMSREMAERPRHADGRFKKKTKGGR